MPYTVLYVALIVFANNRQGIVGSRNRLSVEPLHSSHGFAGQSLASKTTSTSSTVTDIARNTRHYWSQFDFVVLQVVH